MDKLKETLSKRWVQITLAVVVTAAVILLISYMVNKKTNKVYEPAKRVNFKDIPEAEVEEVDVIEAETFDELFSEIYNGTHTIKDAAKLAGIPYTTFHKRYHKYLKNQLNG